jgi:hypothetical protein
MAIATRLVAAIPFMALAALVACAHDVVLPSTEYEPVCGNGVLEVGESCDVQSAGCVSCAIVPDWTCSQAPPGCSQICGDGVVSSGPGCAAPTRDTQCDMTGWWAARETDYERDSVLNHIQVSSNWELFEFTQTGDTFVVTQELDCGVHVTGSETVDYTPGTLSAIRYLNRMDGMGTHPARQGTSVAVGGGCNVSFDRWYDIRGGVDSLLPADFSTMPALNTLPALPIVADPVDAGPTDMNSPPGATDPDGDGIPGMGFQLTGLVNGVRDSVQRDYKGYASTTPAEAAALSFEVDGEFDLQESVMAVTNCGTGCPLGAELATAAGGTPHHITFAFIGKTYGSVRVTPVVVNTLRADLTDDLATCANVKLVLPHDGSIPSGVDAGGGF